MKERQHFVALDDYEHGIVIDSLNEKRKDLINEGKTTDAVDELIVIGSKLVATCGATVASKNRVDNSLYTALAGGLHNLLVEDISHTLATHI